jgi:fermentation-respiration switch protein FrsA (DUF1100 family)
MTAVLTVAALAVAFVAGLWAFQRSLIYFPDGEVPPVSLVLPGAEEVSFETADGVRLGGWFLAAPVEKPAGTVLVFNGNAGNRAYRAGLARALAAEGFAVLLWDYRGYGGNAGRPGERGLIEDARAVRDWLAGRPDVDPARVVYLGESLGSAVAVALAVEAPPAALVLRSPFASLTDVARRHYPFLPVGRLLKDRFDSVGRIPAVSAPLIVVVGSGDRIVPPDSSRRLYDAAGTSTKRWVVVEGADHNDPSICEGPPLIQPVAGFLRAVLAGRPPDGE